MPNHKLILDDVLEEDFALIAIHCGVEDYKMAYLCNQYLGTRLKRSKTDLDFSKEGLVVTFPWYEFENPRNLVDFDLLKNSCTSLKARTIASDGLFFEEDEQTTTSYLIPELKQVDYLLKVSSEVKLPSLKEILPKLKSIPEVVSVYEVSTHNIKSINNLIFD